MSQATRPNDRHIIWSNQNLDVDDWREDYASAYIVFAYGCSADGRITTEPEIVEVHTKGTVDQPDLNSAAKRRRTVSARPAYRVIR